jgi:hypothetical protein
MNDKRDECIEAHKSLADAFTKEATSNPDPAQAQEAAKNAQEHATIASDMENKTSS